MDSARQTLTVMEEKIGQLSAALAGAGFTETTPAPAPKLTSAAIADERAAATAAPSGRVRAAPQKPRDTGGADQRADISGQGPTTARADAAAGLVLFDANVRYLNDRPRKRRARICSPASNCRAMASCTSAPRLHGRTSRLLASAVI